jgi:predicted nucleic acid-binding protein
MYAGGGPHALRQPSADIVRLVRDGEIEGAISAEVVQEILHRFVALRRPELGARMARDALDLFAPVLPLTHEVMDRVPGLLARYPALTARDLVHVATCLDAGIGVVLSPDRGFDRVAELTRIGPDDVDALAAVRRLSSSP